jgi:hypothetical protein
MAISRRRPRGELIHHSDQGSQPEFKGLSQHCRLTSRMVVPSLAVLALVVSVPAASVIAEAA